MDTEKNGDTPQQLGGGIQPSPTPTSVSIATDSNPANPFVILIFDTPTGRSVYFIPPDEMISIAKAMGQAANQAKLGLVLPNIHDIRQARGN